MASLTADRVAGGDRIIENILSQSKCSSCGRKMEMSISIDLDSDRPLRVSWLCRPCSNLDRSMARRDYGVEVPGTSRSERLTSIFYITHTLSDFARSCSSNKLNALNDLFQIVAAEGIRLSYLDLASTETVRGVFFHCDGVAHIMLDEGLKANPTEHLAVFAEEVGRYFASKSTPLGNKEDARTEVVALRWAVNFLASIPSVIRNRVS